MSARGLERIAVLYSTLERIRCAELRAAAGAVEEIVHAAAAEQAARQVQTEAARRALADGDRLAWLLAESGREFADIHFERLEAIKIRRTALRVEASDAHLESQVKLEQVKRVAERMRARQAVLEDRQAQAAADDRHLARRIWRAMNEG